MKSENRSNFYLINKPNTNSKFNIYLSPTTTIIYDLLDKNLKFNIIEEYSNLIYGVNP